MFVYKIVVTTIVALMVGAIIATGIRLKEKTQRGIFAAFVITYLAAVVGMWF